MLAAFLALSIATPPVAGLYPIVPPLGPLAKQSPEKQADLILSWGFTLAGGPFKNDRLPRALRDRGIRTLRIVSVFEGADHWKKQPESRPIDSTGKPLQPDEWYAGVCPNFEPFRKSKLHEIEGLLESGRYDVLVLDFMHWPVLWQRAHPRISKTCYCKACRERFQRDTNVHLPRGSVAEIAKWIDDNQREAWEHWRAERITAFARDVRGLRDRAGKGTLIGVQVVPWTDERLLEVAGQDLRALAAEADVFLPMSYYNLVGQPVDFVSTENALVAKETKKTVWPIVLFDEQQHLTDQQWDRYLSQALHGSNGFIAFPFRGVFKSPGRSALTRHLSELAADAWLR
jgi:hypothetical protein